MNYKNLTDQEFEHYLELGKLLNNGADLTFREEADWKALQEKIFAPSQDAEQECPHKGRYIR
jgi:hypothetical protein